MQSNKNRPKFISIVAVMVAISFCASLAAQSTKHLTLYFSNKVGYDNLSLDSTTYKTKLGQSFTVTNLKYYISNIKLTDDSGKVVENTDGYYLISQSDSASHTIQLDSVPIGNYTNLSFTIGVDSLHNSSGAQTGALDTVNGMFRDWNTGYIFFKLEGKSPASKQPEHVFEYHIGGYKQPSNCIREVSLALAPGLGDQADVVRLNKIGTPDSASLKIYDIHIGADVANVLNSKSVIDFSKLSSVTDSHNATKIADNYQKMFSLGYLRYGYQ